MKDKIIQIITDAEGSITGLSVSGTMYDYFFEHEKDDKGVNKKNEKGQFLGKFVWRKMVESPEKQS